MTPEPPALAGRIPEWQPNELVWIVRHGVKYTGMPAWPATEREDEVWSVVAFLQRLPELNAKSYAALAFGDASPPTSEPAPPANRFETLLDGCARCHGEDGRGRAAGAFPDLSRQSEAYLAATLDAYAGRARESGIMQLAASGLDPADIQALAAHYAASPAGVAPAPGEAADPAADDSGAALVTEGDPAAGIPACANCHRDRESRYPVYPNLAGLDRDYLETQLHLFKQGARGGTAYSHVMQAIASRLSAEQISAVSGHYAAGGGAGGSL
jgi:cytochrome c553